MRHVRLLTGLALFAIVAACDSAPKAPKARVLESPDAHVDAGAECSLHFTAGPIGDPALPCTIEADYVTSSGRTVVEIGGDSGQLTVHFNLTKPGPLDTGVVTNADSGVTGLLDITNGNDDYEMTTTPGSEAGTFRFSVTKAAVAIADERARTYALTGSLDATVPADTTSAAKGKGPVAVHVTFGGK